jgi:transposase
MSKWTRRTHAPSFGAKMALAALKGEKTLTELAHQYDVHPNQITALTAHVVEAAAGLFGSAGAASGAAPAIDMKMLHVKIGELTWRTIFCRVRSPKPAC